VIADKRATHPRERAAALPAPPDIAGRFSDNF
jgi:hypothetical protein